MYSYTQNYENIWISDGNDNSNILYILIVWSADKRWLILIIIFISTL